MRRRGDRRAAARPGVSARRGAGEPGRVAVVLGAVAGPARSGLRGQQDPRAAAARLPDLGPGHVRLARPAARDALARPAGDCGPFLVVAWGGDDPLVRGPAQPGDRAGVLLPRAVPGRDPGAHVQRRDYGPGE